VFKDLPHAAIWRFFDGLLEFLSHSSFQMKGMHPRVISKTVKKKNLNHLVLPI